MALSTLTSCTEDTPVKKGTFEYDVDFLQTYQETILLKNNNSQVAVVPAYQGRIMTSTATGKNGKSYGWLNYDAISSEVVQDKINIYGGEDRFWLGPEGGQFSIFFENGADFTFENWKTPQQIDTDIFKVVDQSTSSVSFLKEMKLTNYQGFPFHIEVRRKINVFDRTQIEKNLNIDLSQLDIDFVGIESVNGLKNIGDQPWSKETGLLSIWILGMLNPSDETTIILPFKEAPNYNTYFGDVPSSNIAIKEQSILLKADGKHRTKLGLPPVNTQPLAGSYDASNNVLTVVQFSVGDETSYVNSLWEIQDEPFKGDVVNVYNDGPLEDGSQLGPFYELESSSPAKELKVNEEIKHHHITYHFEGDKNDLNKICLQLFNLKLDDIKI